MNYQRLHDSIIERARNRTLDEGVYYERHHILPKCEGGEQSGPTVSLTQKEHALVHFLRWKMTSVMGNLAAYNLLGNTSSAIRRTIASHAAKQSHAIKDERYYRRQSNAGKSGGDRCAREGIGFHAMSEEDKKAARAKGTRTTVENKLGMFSDEYREQHRLNLMKACIYNGSQYNSQQELAESLGVSQGTITYWKKKGKVICL